MNEILTQEKSIYLQIAEMIETDILRDILLEEERVPNPIKYKSGCRNYPATALLQSLRIKHPQLF